jgi:hypothetical protein
LARLKVTTDADESMPLDQVPEDGRARVVEKKVWRLRSLFETDLRKAFEYLDDLRSHEAWKYLREPDMERLVENRCRISPAFVEQLRAGYATLRESGHRGRVTAADVRRMQAEQARGEAETVKRGGDRRSESFKVDNVNIEHVERGGNGSAYLLRRLARLGGDWIDRYEAAEFPSVRAAAIAAGIVKVPTALDKLRSAWSKATPEERKTFLAEATHA